MASCGVSVPVSILVMRYFGKKDFPTIFSFCMMASSLSSSVSVPAMGAVYDFTGSYGPAWIAFIFCSVIIVSCLLAVETMERHEQEKTSHRDTGEDQTTEDGTERG